MKFGEVDETARAWFQKSLQSKQQTIFHQQRRTKKKTVRGLLKKEKKTKNRKQEDIDKEFWQYKRIIVPSLEEDNHCKLFRLQEPNLTIRIDSDCEKCNALHHILTNQHTPFSKSKWVSKYPQTKLHWEVWDKTSEKWTDKGIEKAIKRMDEKWNVLLKKKPKGPNAKATTPAIKIHKTVKIDDTELKSKIEEEGEEEEEEEEGEDEKSSESSLSSDDEDDRDEDEEEEEEGEEEEEEEENSSDHHAIFALTYSSLPIPFLDEQHLNKISKVTQISEKKKKQITAKETAEETKKRILVARGRICRYLIQVISDNLFHISAQSNKFRPLRHQEQVIKWHLEEFSRPASERKSSGGDNGLAMLFYARCSSGKTLAALAAMLKQPLIRKLCIAVPKTMVEYWRQDVAKIWDAAEFQEVEINIVGYNKLELLCRNAIGSDGTLKLSKIPDCIENAGVILDEWTIFRNAHLQKSCQMLETILTLQKSAHTMLLSSTPIYNNVFQEQPAMWALMKGPKIKGSKINFATAFKSVSSLKKAMTLLQDELWKDALKSNPKLKLKLSALSENEDEDGEGDDDEEEKVESKRTTKSNFKLGSFTKSFLQQCLQGRSFYYDPEFHDPELFKTRFPNMKVERVNVEMSPQQTFWYLVNRYKDFKLGDRVYRGGVSKNRHEAANKRGVTYCVEEGKPSPKIIKIVENVFKTIECEVKKHKVLPKQVIKSRQIKLGISEIEKALRSDPRFAKYKLRLATVTGQSTNRQATFNAYNAGELEILCLGDVGSIGVDLHGTHTFHEADREPNEQTTFQAHGRVRRLKIADETEPGQKKEKDQRTKKGKGKSETTPTPTTTTLPPKTTIKRYFSVFPKEFGKNITKEDKRAIHDFFMKYDPEPLSFNEYVKYIRKEIKQLKYITYDDVCETRNQKKQVPISAYLAEIEKQSFQVPRSADY